MFEAGEVAEQVRTHDEHGLAGVARPIGDEAMVDDLTNLLPFIILVCVLCICYCFKSVKLGACILTHTIFTILCTVGALGYLSFEFNNIVSSSNIYLIHLKIQKDF